MRVEGDFNADGFAVVRRLADPQVCERVLKQLWVDLRQHGIPRVEHDARVVARPALEVRGPDSPALSHFHWASTAAIESVTGADLLPSCSHFRLYWGGDVCRVHSDRPVNQVGVSLTLGYSDGLPWDLCIGSKPVSRAPPITDDFGDEPYTALKMEPGDAVLYRATRFRHGRIVPNPNRWSAHLLLMWVERGSEFENLAFEQLPDMFD